MQRIEWIAAVGVMAFMCLGVGGGCLPAHYPAYDNSLKGSQATFDIAPKVMMEKIKQIVSEPPLSLGVQEEGKGWIMTGFQGPLPGEMHIARRWQERTQYRIQVIPDFDEPTAKCVIQVRERTETRAADGMNWASLTDATRAERAEAILEAIKQKVGS